MQFLITNTDPLQNAIKTSKAHWKVTSRGLKRYIIFCFSMGSILVLLGFFTSPTITLISEGTRTGYNLDLSFSVGIAMFFTGFLMIRILYVNKREYGLLTDKLISLRSTNPAEFYVEIGPEKVNKCGPDFTINASWKYFTSFRVTDGVMLLAMDERYSSVIAFVIGHMDPEEIQRLKDYVNSKIPEKR